MNKDVCCAVLLCARERDTRRRKERGARTRWQANKKRKKRGEEKEEGKNTHTHTEGKEETRRKEVALNIQTQQTRYNGGGWVGGREEGGARRSAEGTGVSLFQMEIHIIPSSYGNVLLFPDFAIFRCARVRQTKGKRHLNFQTVLYPPINVAMKIDPPSMTNYSHRCIRKHATGWEFTLFVSTVLRFPADLSEDVSSNSSISKKKKKRKKRCNKRRGNP